MKVVFNIGIIMYHRREVPYLMVTDDGINPDTSFGQAMSNKAAKIYNIAFLGDWVIINGEE
jgi:hypothetical protein